MAELTTDAIQNSGSPRDLHRRSECVIVDTNELLSSHLLNRAMGAALLFEIQKQNGKLGWPEVIEDEIRKHAILRAEEAVKRVGDELGVLETLLGWRPDPKLASKEEAGSAISRRIAGLAPLLLRVPFTLEHAKAALRRVNDETPPNGQKNQQFKDSAIWEAILDLAVTHRVHFVTRDNGFYQGRDPKNGLAKELANERDRRGFEIHVYAELASCIEALRKAAPPFDVVAVVAALDAPLLATSRLEIRFFGAASKRYSVTTFPVLLLGGPNWAGDWGSRLKEDGLADCGAKGLIRGRPIERERDVQSCCCSAR